MNSRRPNTTIWCLLADAGACAPTASEDLRDWMWVALRLVTRAFRHPGNHRYVWGLNRAVTRRLAAGQPYPKFIHRAVAA